MVLFELSLTVLGVQLHGSCYLTLAVLSIFRQFLERFESFLFLDLTIVRVDTQSPLQNRDEQQCSQALLPWTQDSWNQFFRMFL